MPVFKGPKLYTLANILVCSICFFLALPATIAIFPQMSEVCVANFKIIHHFSN